LKHKIQIAICAAVQNPVVHIKLIQQSIKHLPKDFECFGFCKKSAFIDFLNVETFIDGEFS
jgi:hypothetical protein